MDPVDWGKLFADVLPNLGVSGALALFIFHTYRKDTLANAARLAEILEDQKRQTDGWISVVRENTVQLERMNNHVMQRGTRTNH